MFEAFVMCVLAAFGGTCVTFLIATLLTDTAIEHASHSGRFAGLGAEEPEHRLHCEHHRANAAARHRRKARRTPFGIEA